MSDVIMELDYEVIGDLMVILEKEKFEKERRLNVINCDYERGHGDIEILGYYEQDCDRIDNVIKMVKEKFI